MKRLGWVLGCLSAVGVLAAAGVQLPQAAGATTDLSSPTFRAVPAQHLAARSAAVARAAAVPSAARTAEQPAGRAAVAKTTKEQALSIWPGVVGTVTSPQPDLSLAVGPKQVLQVSDAGARVVTKSTGVPVNATGNLQKLFNVSGVTVSEPTAAYDPVGKRFVLVGITTNTTTNAVGIVVRVSKGSTASTNSSAWRTPYGYLAGGTTTESAPRLGVSADKVVLALAASDTSDASVAHLTVVIPKQKLYSAGSSGPKAWVGTSDSTYDGQTPVVNASNQKTAFLVVPAAGDFTLISYTGPATKQAPVFVKSVTYSTKTLVDAPDVAQSGGDTITLPPAVFTASASWRSNVLWTGLTVGCTPSGDTVQRACLRLVRLSTAAPAPALTGEFTLAAKGQDWFGPGVGVDQHGSPHVGFSRSNAAAAPGAVSAAVIARTSGGSWTKALTLSKGTAPFSDGSAPASAPWATRGSASVDPTAPWDVWVAPALSTGKLTAPVPNWATMPARVSFAKNSAVTKVSATTVRKGTRVTVTARLLRPGGSDGVKGLPVVLQQRVGSGKWVTVGSAKTAGNGAHRWTVKVSRTTAFRTVGKAVAQKNGQGRSVAGVTGKAVRVTVRR